MQMKRMHILFDFRPTPFFYFVRFPFKPRQALKVAYTYLARVGPLSTGITSGISGSSGMEVKV